MYNQEQWFDRAHNEFLDWLVAGGLPAFLLYISFFVLACLAVMRATNLSVPEKAALIGVLAAYAFNNLFVFDNLLSLMYFYLTLAFAHSVSKQALPGWMPLSKPGNDQMVAVAAPIVLVLVVGGVWMLNVPGISRAQTLISALQPNNPKTGVAYTTEDHLNSFTKALTQGELGKQETIEQLFQFASNSIAPSASVSPETKQKAYTITEAAGKALEAERKNDARLELFMGVFYNQFGQYDNALVELNKAVLHSPTKQQILFQTGVTYLQKGDTTNAVALFKKAYELETNYADARILYATGLFYAGKEAEADKLLTDGFGTVFYDDNRLLQTYTSLKMNDRVIGIWNARVEKAPKDTNILLGLASAYFSLGNTAQTIATIRKVIEIDPNSKAQMESIIKQIEDGTLKPQ
jgi:tetratricopeptide (TPR) repeat protein